MAISNTPLEGMENVLPETFEMLTGSTTAHDSMLNLFGEIEIFINFLNWVAPALLVITFFTYLIRWVLAEDKSITQKVSAGGVWRSLLAMFLLFNIYAVLSTLMYISNISVFAAYWIFILSFVLILFWSFLNLGENIVVIFSQIFNNVLDYLVIKIQNKIGKNPSDYSFSLRSSFFLKFIIVLVLGILITIFIWL